METQSASSTSVPSPYGRACTTCSKAKAKCVLSREGDVKCERYVTTDPLGTCHVTFHVERLVDLPATFAGKDSLKSDHLVDVL